MEKVKGLDASQLCQRTDPEQFNFETTADVDDLQDPIGQPRAVQAMQFGTGIERKGFNVFALGPSGMDKRAFVSQFFAGQAQSEAVPSDWCYANNFAEPHRPQAIGLPAGMGVRLRQDMEQLVEELRTALAASFESEEYQTRRQVIAEEFKERQEQAFKGLQERAQEGGLAVLRTPAGLAFAPVRDGEVLSREEVEKLGAEKRQQLEQEVETLQEELQKILRQMPSWQRDMRDKMRELDREVATLAVGGLMDELRERYSDYDRVAKYLDDVRKDVVENASEFFPSEQDPSTVLSALLGGAGAQREPGGPALLRRYRVNVLVDHSSSEGAPVVYEDNPTYQNLIGRVEHMAQMGALVTDFNLVKAGALHRANGGYLMLDARELLLQPYAWDGLKRALQSGQLRIESLGQMLSLVSTVSLEPEPIALDVKVALLGEPMLYYLLWQLDPDFADLFKVAADLEERMERSPENQLLYARLIATLARRHDLRPFDRGAVARVIEHSARVAGDAAKLSTHMRSISDLLQEADYQAGEAGSEVVTADAVQHAIDAQIYRSDRLRERAQEAILRDTLLIDTEGEAIGQVNGLSVAQLGSFAFGRPTRITAQVRMGKGEVVDIEREVELGGPIHSKGVLILSGFLGGRYAAERPLSLSASLVFEQSYSGVEGDSASSAELYALLSAIAEVPLRQSLAVTGSVNQRGQVQAIGGVNEKIEGFFDVCRARGLTGEQGVLIPAANVKHLMLRQDVVDAVAAGQFQVYPVEFIDQGIEILTGVPAGERDEGGHYAEGTVNYLVEKRLAQLAEKRAEFSPAAGEGEV
ncbi:MAG: ATP-dependent protease [Anaerolineae bacterium SM23_84]|nr:MAG: ATP-dependent protease [Anaerolineae bacterium SM23_84]